jgi:ABC-type phosphate transport system substrate-binding protein
MRSMNRRLAMQATLCLALVAPPALAANEIAIIVHKDNPAVIDTTYVTRIYTGLLKGWPDGSPVFPLDQSEDAPARRVFYARLVGKSPAAMKAIWSQNIFTGKGLPPKVASPDAEMMRIVSTNRNAIGYMLASQVDASVRVIARVAE